MKKLILIFFIAVSVFGQSYTYQLGNELITNQADRDFSGTNNWVNVSINSYNTTGALNITANGSGQYCRLPVGNAPMTVGRIYRLKMDVSNIVSTWRIYDGTGTQQFATINSNSAFTIDFLVSVGTGGFWIYSSTPTSSATIDNISLKEVLSKSLIAKPKRNFIYNTQESDASLVFSYNGEKPVNGVLVDKSTYQNNGTLYGGTVYNGGVEGGLSFNGRSSYVSVADANSLDFGTGDFTLSVFVDLKAITTSQRLLSKRTGTDYFELYISPDSPFGWRFIAVSSGGSGNVGTLSAPSLGFQLITITRTSSLLSIYVNGVLISTGASNVGSISNTSNLGIGLSTAGGGYLNADVYQTRLYNRALTATEVREKYNKLARQVSLYEDFSDYTVGSFPREWTKKSGTFTVQQTTTDEGIVKKGTKYLRCDVAGIVAIPSNQAYDTWEFDLYKGADANGSIVYIAGYDRDGYVNNVGYRFSISTSEGLFLVKENNAIENVLMNSNTGYVANTTWYKIKVTRTTAGIFTIYIKGGAFGNNYVLVSTSGGLGSNPVTDNTYTTSNWFVLDLDAGDRFGGLVLTKGVVIQ